MSARRTLALIVGLVAFTACGGGAKAPAFEVRGTAIVVQSDAPFTQRSDFASRVETTLDAALHYWGGSWTDIAGRSVVFEGGHVQCRGAGNAVGCYDGDIHVSTSDAGVVLRCVEETVLVHEVGHSVIGDPDHQDPRWMDFSAVMQDLQGRAGYALDGDGGCPIYLSMWRHPPQS